LIGPRRFPFDGYLQKQVIKAALAALAKSTHFRNN
jgi:hypothetical protein